MAFSRGVGFTASCKPQWVRSGAITPSVWSSFRTWRSPAEHHFWLFLCQIPRISLATTSRSDCCIWSISCGRTPLPPHSLEMARWVYQQHIWMCLPPSVFQDGLGNGLVYGPNFARGLIFEWTLEGPCERRGPSSRADLCLSLFSQLCSHPRSHIFTLFRAKQNTLKEISPFSFFY